MVERFRTYRKHSGKEKKEYFVGGKNNIFPFIKKECKNI